MDSLYSQLKETRTHVGLPKVEITGSMITGLRDATDISIHQAKKLLRATNGDIAEAIRLTLPGQEL